MKPKSSFLGPVLFSIFGTDVSEDIKESLIRSADPTKLEEIVNMINALIIIQRDLTGKNVRSKPQMEFNKNKCKADFCLKKVYKDRMGENWQWQRLMRAAGVEGKKENRKKVLGF